MFLSLSITLSDQVCHLSKCPEAIYFFFVVRVLAKGLICLVLFSSDPSNIFIMYFAIRWFFFASKCLNSAPTVHVFVAGIHHFKVLFKQSF